MGRKPTGNPKGRPKGTGRLSAEVKRFTVRLPKDLHDRLMAFAEGRHYHRGDPQLSDCARDAIEHYLVCPDKRLTLYSTAPSSTSNCQTETDVLHTAPWGETTQPRRTLHTVDAGVDDNGPTDNRTAPRAPDNEQTQKGVESPPEAKNASAVNVRQPTKRTMLARRDAEDLEDMPLEPENGNAPLLRQTENAPGYDTSKKYLGKLCKGGHEYQNTGKTLLQVKGQYCLKCHAEQKAAKRQTASKGKKG